MHPVESDRLLRSISVLHPAWEEKDAAKAAAQEEKDAAKDTATNSRAKCDTKNTFGGAYTRRRKYGYMTKSPGT